jgi:CubicO group peptidase (beta-lactamase class C family)
LYGIALFTDMFRTRNAPASWYRVTLPRPHFPEEILMPRRSERLTTIRSRAMLAASVTLVALAACASTPSAGALDQPAPAGASGGLLPAAPHTLSEQQRTAIRDSLQAVINRAVADSAFPGAYAVIGNSRGIIAEYGAGKLDAADPTRPDSRTVWDMASMSKLMATTSAMIQLVGSKRVALDSPVVYYLPSWKAEGTSRITVRQLLTHSSGLPAGRPLYKEADTDTAARTIVYNTALASPPGTKYVYSDLGFILLGRLVQQVTGQPLDRYVQQNIFGPLKMADTRYLPPASWMKRIAPTEIDPWRGRHIRGEVHDENASRLGGVAGHAGIFSSAHDVARFAEAYLSGGDSGREACVRQRDAQSVHRRAGQGALSSRTGLGNGQRHQLGRQAPVATVIRSYGFHRHLSVDGPDP